MQIPSKNGQQTMEAGMAAHSKGPTGMSADLNYHKPNLVDTGISTFDP